MFKLLLVANLYKSSFDIFSKSTFEFLESFFIASGMLLSFGAVYFLLCKIDEALKHESLISKNMKNSQKIRIENFKL